MFEITSWPGLYLVKHYRLLMSVTMSEEKILLIWKKKINNRIILSLMISFKFFIIILVTGISGLSLIIFGKPKLRKQIPLSNTMHSLVFCMKFWVENLLNLKDYYPLSVMIKILAIMKCLVTAYENF